MTPPTRAPRTPSCRPRRRRRDDRQPHRLPPPAGHPALMSATDPHHTGTTRSNHRILTLRQTHIVRRPAPASRPTAAPRSGSRPSLDPDASHRRTHNQAKKNKKDHNNTLTGPTPSGMTSRNSRGPELHHSTGRDQRARSKPRVESPVGGERLCGPQHDAKPAASLGVLPGVGGAKGVPSPRNQGEGVDAGRVPLAELRCVDSH